jgi:glycyl-tRNA synthetase beta chain
MKEARADFLLEIGCEEIPARMLPRAAEELQVILEKYFSAHSLLEGTRLEVFGAPRRLVAAAPALLLRQPDSFRETLGPPKAVAFDPAGRPTRAAESFAAKQGVSVASLYVVTTQRGEYMAAKQTIRGRSAEELLREILPRAILELSFPRSMYWGSADGPRFVRPIRWLVALLGARVLPIAIGEVRAGRETMGHRSLGKPRIPVAGLADYLKKLAANYVLARPDERRKKVERELGQLARSKALRVRSDPALLEEVVYLNEYPTAILGGFEPDFLELPEEILVTVMRDHQKYFAVEHRDGSLAPHFLAVINLDRDREGLVRAGHERVLRARFADARFFWQTDQKCRLADYLPRLKHVMFQSRLGSYFDKIERIRWLARWVAEQWFNSGIHQADVPAGDRAAELSKCDLVTEMVGEFPELQGIVGGLYARAQDEPEEVVWAIYDQYRPAGLDDSIPRNLAGCTLALADKLDTLVGCFAVGLVPSGSSDPFALRRAALGVVKILLERSLPLSLSAAISAAARALASHPPGITPGAPAEKQVLEFILDRARYVFRERHGYAYDEVSAALAASADDLVDAERRIAALRATRRTRNFAPLAIAFKRTRNILEKAGPPEKWKLPAVRLELLKDPAERALETESARVAARSGELRRAGRYREALEVIAELRPAVDRFFDDVLVMAEDENVRRNRLTLLAEMLKEFSAIADFSEIATDGT